MKHGLNERRATALIRRQRNVEEYKKVLKQSLEEFNKEHKVFLNEENFAGYKHLVKYKLKLAEKEVATLKERVVTYEQ